MATTEKGTTAKPQSNITEAHVTAALKTDKGSDAQLTSWSVEDFTQRGDNYASVVTSVNVKFTFRGRDQSTSYVVKLNPERTMDTDMEIFCTAIFKKEIEFFEDILPLLNSELTALSLHELRMARCYYSSLEEGREMIFLEDLRPRGFKLADRKKCLDLPHTTLVMQELARMHAASLLLQARTPDVLEKFKYVKQSWLSFTDTSSRMLHDMMTPAVANAEEILHKLEGYEGAKQWLARTKDDCVSVLERLLIKTEKFDVICHGDCWNNNMLFRCNEDGEPVEVMLLDLQLNHVSSLATDLNYLLYTSLHGDDRKANMQDYLTTYHAAFKRVMEAGDQATPFTLQELGEEYKRLLEYGVLFSMTLLAVVVSEGGDIPDIHEMRNKDMSKVMEEVNQVGNNMMESNPEFHSRFLSLFEDLNEHGATF